MTNDEFPEKRFYALQDRLIWDGILRHRGNKIYNLISMWKSKWDEDVEEEFLYLCNFFSSRDELMYCLKNSIIPIGGAYICTVCHKNKKKFVGGSRGWRATCEKCSPNKDPNKLKVYHDRIKSRTDEDRKEIRDKTRKTLEEKYNDPNYGLFGSVSFKDKMEAKHGNRNYNNSDKIKATCLDRYGVSSVLLTEEVKNKSNSPEAVSKANKARIKTCLDKHGVEYISQVDDFKGKAIEAKRTKSMKYMMENDCILFADLLRTYGQEWLSLDIPRIYHDGNTFISRDFVQQIEDYSKEGTHTNGYVSDKEKELSSHVKSLGVSVIENDTSTVSNRNGRYYELDVYVPDKKIAFDFDGMYWHSSLFKDKNYHMRKSDYCREDGIRLIHVFEDLWDEKKDIYKSIINSSLGIYDRRIYARNCEVVELSTDEYKDFLSKNHLFGSINSSKRLGLVYKSQLVQVIGFGKSRFESGEVELYRMCTLLDTQVIGGFSKLIKHSGIKNFISYVDLSIYTGQGYTSSGFEVIGKTEPGYVYYKDGLRYNRMNFQKSKLKDVLEVYDESLSEYENMLNNRYFRVYDSGNLKVRYKED